jgi:hypothetical protein
LVGLTATDTSAGRRAPSEVICVIRGAGGLSMGAACDQAVRRRLAEAITRANDI